MPKNGIIHVQIVWFIIQLNRCRLCIHIYKRQENTKAHPCQYDAWIHIPTVRILLNIEMFFRLGFRIILALAASHTVSFLLCISHYSFANGTHPPSLMFFSTEWVCCIWIETSASDRIFSQIRFQTIKVDTTFSLTRLRSSHVVCLSDSRQ